MATKRIAKEYADLSQSPPPAFTIALAASESLHTWHITLRPAEPSVYNPGQFGILLTLPTDYPFKPPVVKFVTRIYHPNVTDECPGSICLSLLKSENWKPSTKIINVLEALDNLLLEPQPDDPLDDRIAEQYKNDRPAWEKQAKAYVQKYAMQEPEFPST
ncbi:hypothetical protein VHEMI08380 [[Torrubiella] hemipterigena]|uniref:E2 ubiquitin-conjugating enzyme n=1 Tax=[Torrubiella] hemipterigena TaxID=1531966 RepID=A0A0A1TNE6_9HYPO|nr:hypothetical protein VHEMI08380 [[Torrubiella] hemipterigena]